MYIYIICICADPAAQGGEERPPGHARLRRPLPPAGARTHTHTHTCVYLRARVRACAVLALPPAGLRVLARASACARTHLWLPLPPSRIPQRARARIPACVCVCVFLESADGLAGLGWIPAGGPPDPPAPPPLPCRAAAGAAARTLASGKRADPRTRTPLPPSARPTNAPIRRARGAPRRQLFSKTGSIAFLGDFKPLTF